MSEVRQPGYNEQQWTDPLLGPSGSRRLWTTVNAAEAMPGVPTPLTWSWYDEGTENAQIAALAAIGVVPRRRAVASDDRDERHLGVFHGRAALNIDVWRRMADAIPGASGNSLERDLLGSVRPDAVDAPDRRRYPVVAGRLPVAMVRARRQMVAQSAQTRRWWRAAVENGTPADPQRLFADAFRRCQAVAMPHLVNTIAAQAAYEQLTRLCRRAGAPGLERTVVTGMGSMEEAVMLGRLWEVARGAGDRAGFLRDYGFWGPFSGEFANASWREDPAVLEPLCTSYRALPDDHGPGRVGERQLAERTRARDRLFDGLPRGLHPVARSVIRLVHAFLPFRETGRATVLMTVDAGRIAARAFGTRLTVPADVVMLTVPELVGRGPLPSADELAFRRERREGYQRTVVPDFWSGIPDAVAPADIDRSERSPLRGIAVSAGVAEGPARVVDDPVGATIEPGEILVCHTTDPSWSSLFLIATGVVTDIGGPISHGAIVAREMGIPCVVNTGDGSRRVRTGDRIRLDGDSGTVEWLTRHGN